MTDIDVADAMIETLATWVDQEVAPNAATYELPDEYPEDMVQQMAEFATLARKEGLLALEEKLDGVQNPFNVGSIVRTAAAERGPLWRRIQTVGYVAFDERNISHIHLRTDGWIEKLFLHFTFCTV